MKRDRSLRLLSLVRTSQDVAHFMPQLDREQLECLKRGARGITLRFERSELVDVLVAAGYAEKGLAGVITVTRVGHEYLKTHAD
ncbi:MAG: hypothetical protein C5B58_05835 [Acidobacteria bacterium]|nr:MAG: hypothetical protein C5B58_05835 [Acidobacteriota bacterium]